MSSSRSVVTIALLVAVVTGVTFATGAAAADGTSPLENVLEDGQEAANGFLGGITRTASTTWAAGGGFQDRAGFWLAQRLPDSVDGLASNQNATSEAKQVQRYYNVNNRTLEEYASARHNWTSNQTVALTLYIDGQSAERYLLANATNGSIEDSRMVRSTTRTPNHYLELCGYAATQAREELARFTEDYAEPNKTPSQAYRAQMAAKYSGSVETDLYPSSGSCTNDSATI